MELEEAITKLKRDISKPLACGDITIVCIDDLETVLNYINNSIPKEVIEKKLSEIQPKYNKNVAKINKEEFSQISIEMFNGIKLETQRGILQELLEGK